jgi:hypothetical protein
MNRPHIRDLYFKRMLSMRIRSLRACWAFAQDHSAQAQHARNTIAFDGIRNSEPKYSCLDPFNCSVCSYTVGCTHRVHTEWLWPISGVKSIVMENQPWPGRMGGDTHPLSLYFPSRTKLQCTLHLRGHIRSQYFISTLYVLCGCTLLGDHCVSLPSFYTCL